ncbi:hypothetical protein AVEN_112454-1 [Araneus ventricosus]|uniref:Uncharacterized protein n=1 Tax=Araneus ventricosus TaxID=182803 RepID=A0A4Y2M4F2_ARAVE|nr:hypothetical protein AVEN_112454-1 [Araneus ventricosus]
MLIGHQNSGLLANPGFPCNLVYSYGKHQEPVATKEMSLNNIDTTLFIWDGISLGFRANHHGSSDLWGLSFCINKFVFSEMQWGQILSLWVATPSLTVDECLGEAYLCVWTGHHSSQFEPS